MSPTKISNVPEKTSYDIVIVGGAMLGSSVAWFLASNPDFGGSILVVERDPTYEFTSTAHTNSCMRQQFSSEINVRVSQFAAEFVKNFREFMGNDPRVPDVPLHSYGYMYLADNEPFADVLRESQKVQAACGAGTRIMSADEIKRDYPFYKVDDIVAGSHNPVDEGYFDGNTMFDWWKRSARERGAEYTTNEVVAMTRNAAGTRVESVTLKSGEVIACGTVVNASGPRAVRTSAHGRYRNPRRATPSVTHSYSPRKTVSTATCRSPSTPPASTCARTAPTIWPAARPTRTRRSIMTISSRITPSGKRRPGRLSRTEFRSSRRSS